MKKSILLGLTLTFVAGCYSITEDTESDDPTDTESTSNTDTDTDGDTVTDGDTDTDTGSYIDTDTGSYIDTDTQPEYGCTKGVKWGSGEVEITDTESLAALSGYTEIGDTLVIDAQRLTHLDGLSCLESVGGNMYISGNLGDIDGLANLAKVDGDLSLARLPALTSLSGLRSLNSIGGYFNISGCNRLRALDGLESLRQVEGELIIEHNKNLPTCEAHELMNQLEVLYGGVCFWENKPDTCEPLDDSCV